MAENSRKNHANFIAYQEFIVAHSNYKNLYFTRNAKDNSIRWVITGKSDEGQLRRAWWIEKCKHFDIKVEAGAFAKVAVLVHPTKFHVCQICGKKLSVEYIYPNKNLLKKYLDIFGISFLPFDKNVFEINLQLIDNQKNIADLIVLFKAPESIENVEELNGWIYENHTKKGSKSFLSPGVMSNPPDRYDGFHSDGNCCRAMSDKGRHKENLQRYGQDRRVYENWADGDWKQADRLMSKYREYGMSADHIGPISLGFCHRPKFHSLTREENSAKNNRMSLSDIQILIVDEKNGEQVVSWHSKYIWDLLKNQVKSDEDAVKLSALMRTNLHWVLTIFAALDEQGFRDYLMQFLNLEYSDYDYKFPVFTLANIGKIEKIDKKGKNQTNNKERYVRVAFESLEEYKEKDNRRNKGWKLQNADKKLAEIIESLTQNDIEQADLFLQELLLLLATDLANNWQKV